MLIRVKTIVDEDFVNYKTPSMYIAFPTCTFKCEKECNYKIRCHNSSISLMPTITVSTSTIVKRFTDNPITKAIVIGGLEAFDSFNDLMGLVRDFRSHTDVDIVIYTGYNRSEISDSIHQLSQFPNIIIKFGRFIPDQPSHIDPILGVSLASNNQYAELISLK